MSEPLGPVRANRPDVIDETFDGEAVLVNLASGCYYALDPVASALWRLLAEGRSPAAVASAVARHGAISQAEAADTVERFARVLLDEGLVVACENDAGAPGDDDALAEIGTGTPRLERFTDMQDLLALDPIHDIALDGDGWPVSQGAEPLEPAA